ncbi:hypothetical protein Slin_6638 [Spirosoma linguale DSM 74]|uniref:Uncharacterized protein n=1 Tax=Spirosoma linguale (strain ATCC 33905 / DSM 74 / LMG 10896 / Claus 1) TaxID=504472 RepID=D2QUW3_SPILD|nr:hypothetical protein Slin_6638 [Spirosoma linguale DSM 74]
MTEVSRKTFYSKQPETAEADNNALDALRKRLSCRAQTFVLN